MFEIISYASSDDLNDRKFLHKLRADFDLDSNDDKTNVVVSSYEVILNILIRRLSRILMFFRFQWLMKKNNQ